MGMGQIGGITATAGRVMNAAARQCRRLRRQTQQTVPAVAGTLEWAACRRSQPLSRSALVEIPVLLDLHAPSRVRVQQIVRVELAVRAQLRGQGVALLRARLAPLRLVAPVAKPYFELNATGSIGTERAGFTLFPSDACRSRALPCPPSAPACPACSPAPSR